jgi:hypothetical protein
METWRTLFDRAAETAVDLDDVRERLRERRDERA